MSRRQSGEGSVYRATQPIAYARRRLIRVNGNGADRLSPNTKLDVPGNVGNPDEIAELKPALVRIHQACDSGRTVLPWLKLI